MGHYLDKIGFGSAIEVSFIAFALHYLLRGSEDHALPGLTPASVDNISEDWCKYKKKARA